MTPLVSVIIPAYNAAKFIVATIRSVLEQSYGKVEVLVIDDGSTDNTAAALAPFQARIRYIPQPNRGESSARNRGLGESRGEYVIFLDADDLLAPGMIARAVGALEKLPDFSAVYGLRAAFTSPTDPYVFRGKNDWHSGRTMQNRSSTEKGEGAWPPTVGDEASEDASPADLRTPAKDGILSPDESPDGSIGIESVRRYAKPAHSGNIFPDVMRGATLVPGQFLLHRRCFRDVPGFRDDLQFGEDWDFLLRITYRFPFLFVPEVFLKKRQHPQMQSLAKDRPDIVLLRQQILRDIFGEETEALSRRYLNRRVYADWYRSIAFSCVQSGDVSKALLYMWKSLACWPLQPKIALWLIYQACPPALKASLKRMKHAPGR